MYMNNLDFFSLNNLKLLNKMKVQSTFPRGIYQNNRSIAIKAQYYFVSVLVAASLITGCSKSGVEQKAKDGESQTEAAQTAQTDNMEDITKGPMTAPVIDKNFKLAKMSNDGDMAAPVAGFGQKSEQEIMQEKPRKPSIAVIGPLNGELDIYGIETSNGAEMASDAVDAMGGINGQEFELLVIDTKGEIIQARMAFEAAVSREVLAIVGAATSEVSFSSTKLINDNQVIMVSAGSRRRLGDSGPYNFRITLNEKSAVRSLIDYIKTSKKWKKVAIFSTVANDYSIQLSAAFKIEALEQEMDITHEIHLWPTTMTHLAEGDSSIPDQIAKLKSNMPDALFFSGEGAEANEIVKEMRKQGVKIPLIGSEDLMVPEYLALGEEINGTVTYGGFNPHSEKYNVKKFVKEYTDRFGHEPTRMAALSFDAYNLLYEAIKKSPSLRPSHVRNALVAIKNYNGVTGRITFDETGEAIKEPFIFEVQKKNKGFEFVGVREPS